MTTLTKVESRLMAVLGAASTPFGSTNPWDGVRVDYSWYNYQTGNIFLNEQLRVKGGKAPAKLVAHLDKDMRPSTQDSMLYRGFGVDESVLSGWVDNPRQLVGKVFFDPAYASTTTNRKVALDFEAGVLLTIHAPKGTMMLSMVKALGTTTDDYYHHESEYILARGTKLQITKASVQTRESAVGKVEEFIQLAAKVVH